MRHLGDRIACSLLCILALSAYLAAGLWHVGRPGPFYDETIQLLDSCRLAGKWGQYPIPSQYFALRIRGQSLPIMWRAGYLGPGKTYLFALIFAFFPPSIETVRITTVLLGLVSLAFTFSLAQRLWGCLTAAVAVFLLGTDLSYVLLHRMDHGPVAMMMTCATGSIFFFVKWWEDRRAWALSAGAFLLGLGMMEKITFLGFIFSLLIAGTLALRGRLWRRLACRPTLPALLAGGLGVFPFLFFHFHRPRLLYRLWAADAVSLGFRESLRRVFNLAIETLDGTFEQQLIFGRTVSAGWTPYLLLGAALFGLALLADPRRRRAILNARTGFVAALVALMLGMLIAIPRARSSWHFMMIYPFPQILASLVMVEFCRPPARSSAARNRWRAGGVLLLAGLAAAVNLQSLFLCVREIDVGRVSPLWSTRIYDLADYLRRRPEQIAVCMDWGFYANLAFLLRGEVRMKDRWRDFSGDRRQAVKRCYNYLRSGGHCFLFHPPELTIYPRPRLAFQEASQTLGLPPARARSFSDSNGREIYEVYAN